tara:strand:+ start:229 stop:699 length:471 start_codon:yes stop_codon:yes gene_type:complete
MGQNSDGLEILNIDRSSYRLRIIHSIFNRNYTDKLLEDSCAELNLNGINNSQITITAVPGALEIPFLIRTILKIEDCDGILALGCVIRGETYHFEIVATESAKGIREASCEKNIPCINGVLTVENKSQAYERSLTKGRGFAQALIYMVDLSKSLEK